MKKRKIVSTLMALLCAAIAVANNYIVSDLAEARVERILETEPTEYTNAIITKYSDRNSHGGTRHYVIIEYSTGAKNVTQAIYDYERIYTIGQKLRVKYSVQFPEMFRIVRRL